MGNGQFHVGAHSLVSVSLPQILPGLYIGNFKGKHLSLSLSLSFPLSFSLSLFISFSFFPSHSLSLSLSFSLPLSLSFSLFLPLSFSLSLSLSISLPLSYSPPHSVSPVGSRGFTYFHVLCHSLTLITPTMPLQMAEGPIPCIIPYGPFFLLAPRSWSSPFCLLGLR